MSDTKLYARLRVKTGEYTQDGKTKNRYSDIGVMFASEHFNNMFLQIDTLPVSKEWDGRVFVNPIEEKKEDRPLKQHEVLEKARDVAPTDIDDKPIDLSELHIPF